jgi:hypothetical protein
VSESVFHDLTLASQRKYAGIRRKVQFFSTFAGGVIEALRELGFRLSNIEKESGYRGYGAQSVHGVAQAVTAASGGKNLELYFEQRDNDQCRVLIVPYRTDLPYLSKNHFTAQLGLELSRYSSDPDVLRQAMNVNSRGQLGGFLGGMRGKSIPKLYLNSPPDLKQPGSMTFELRGARLVVSMNVLVELNKFRVSDFDLDIDAIKKDLEAYFYGLEKYLSLLLQNFGTDVTIQEGPAPSAETVEPDVEDVEEAFQAPVAETVVESIAPPVEVALEPPVVEPSPPIPAPAEPPPPEPTAPATPPSSPTVPLSTAQTINLSPAQLTNTLADLETPRRPRPMLESDRDEPAAGEPLQDISLPFDVSEEEKTESNIPEQE